MVSDPLTNGWYGRDHNAADAMLIVCPDCATSYMIDPSTLGAAGRTVRCARCKVSWFAGGDAPAPEMTGTEGGVIAVAEAQNAGDISTEPSAPADSEQTPMAPVAAGDFAAASDVPGGDGPHNDAAAESDAPAPPPAPEAVVEAPPLAPAAESEPAPPAPPQDDSEEVENYAARRKRLQARRVQNRRSTRWTAVALVLLGVNIAVIGGRNEVVRFLPQTASFFDALGLPVNLRQLVFENVKISKQDQDGVGVLIVQGTIVSTASKPVTVPRLRFAARDETGQEIYTWTLLPSQSILGPHEHLDFRSRLASPPSEARNVLVRFVGPQDIVEPK